MWSHDPEECQDVLGARSPGQGVVPGVQEEPCSGQDPVKRQVLAQEERKQSVDILAEAFERELGGVVQLISRSLHYPLSTNLQL